MSNVHDTGGNAPSARITVADLSEGMVNILEDCLGGRQALQDHVDSTIVLFEYLGVNKLVEWINTTPKLGTQNTIRLVRELRLLMKSQTGVDTLPTRTNKPIVPAIPPLARSQPHSHSGIDSGVLEVPVLTDTLVVPCSQPDCRRVYKHRTVTRFLPLHLKVDHNIDKDQAEAETIKAAAAAVSVAFSAAAAATRSEHRKWPKPTIPMKRARQDTGDSTLPVETDLLNGMGKHLDADDFNSFRPPFFNVSSPRLPAGGTPSIQPAVVESQFAPYTSGPNQLYGEQNFALLTNNDFSTDRNTPHSSYFEGQSEVAPRLDQRFLWSSVPDCGFPTGDGQLNPLSLAPGDGIDTSAAADAVNRHFQNQDHPFAPMN